MDLIVIPQALMVFYGLLVLGCGSALGFVLARNIRKQISEPDPPLLLERRIEILEQELEETQSDLSRLAQESSFLRELRAPEKKSDDLSAGRRRFVA